MQTNLITRVHAPSPRAFVSEFVNEQRPALLTGVIDRWPAAKRWSPSFLKENFPETEIKYEVWRGEADHNDPLEFHREYTSKKESIADFIDLLTALKGPSKEYYAAEFPVFDAIPELKADVESLEAFMGFPKLMTKSMRRKAQIKPALWFGPKGSISALHFDRANNLFAQLYGRKEWTVIEPKYREELAWPCYDFSPAFMHFSPIDVSNPNTAHRALLDSVPRETFVINPGELLFLPAAWWHFVRGLETSISLNFFWIDALRNPKALKHYAYSFLRRHAQLGLARLSGN